MYVSIMAMYLPDSASGVVAAKEVFRLIDQSSKIDAVEPDGEVRNLGDGSICLKEAYLLAVGGLIISGDLPKLKYDNYDVNPESFEVGC